MSHHLTQPEEIDLAIMAEHGVEGIPESHSFELMHDCDGSVAATDPANMESDLYKTNQGDIS